MDATNNSSPGAVSRADGEEADGLVSYQKPEQIMNPVLQPPAAAKQRQSLQKETLSQMLQLSSKDPVNIDLGQQDRHKSALLNPSKIVTNFMPIA